MTDWPQLEAEMDRRICKELATEIAKIVEHNAGERWSFAAPESIYAKIVEHLPPRNPGADRGACRVRSGETAGGGAAVALPLASTDLIYDCVVNKDEIQPKRNVRKERKAYGQM